MDGKHMGQGMIKMIMPKAVLLPCHLAHARQSRMQNRPMAGPDSPAQALAQAGQENTRARPAQGFTGLFGACRNRWQRGGDHDHTFAETLQKLNQNSI